MPNRKTHIRIAIGTAVGAYLLECYVTRALFCPDTLALRAVGGVLGGTLPDLLEPATHPGHRRFAHSLATGTLLATKTLPATYARVRRIRRPALPASVGCARTLESPGPTMRERDGLSQLSIGLQHGYLSHLIADARTPKSLPLLGL